MIYIPQYERYAARAVLSGFQIRSFRDYPVHADAGNGQVIMFHLLVQNLPLHWTQKANALLKAEPGGKILESFYVSPPADYIESHF